MSGIWQWNLQKKVLFPVLAVLVVIMAASILIVQQRISSAIETATNQQITRLASSTSLYLSSWIKRNIQDVVNWSKIDVFRDSLEDTAMGEAMRTAANAWMIEIQKEYPFYEVLGVANSQGAILSSSMTGLIGQVNIKDRPYFQEALSGKTAVSDVIISRATGNPAFVIAAPVRRDPDIVGVLFGSVDLSHFSRTFVDSVKIGAGGYAYITDQQGKILAYPDRSRILKIDISEHEFGKRMLAQRAGLIRYTFEGVDKIVGFQSDSVKGWLVAVTAPVSEMYTAVREMQVFLMVASGVMVLMLSALLWLVITRFVTRPLKNISEIMQLSSEEVRSASQQVSSSGQSLAQSASEQAASIEETCAALEEISSMTKRNAEHACQADRLVTETGQIIGNASRSMVQLAEAMQDIARSSEETQKIVKTIDEIAFQTNLLALNAAVEAARAGEAGAGFAVVADEVRNLAIRAAEAAKSTSDLIEGSVRRITGTTALAGSTNAAFAEVSSSSKKIAGLVGEINAASSEQAQAIDQISRTVSEMDKVVQQNAAHAEESASASQGLNAEAEQVKSAIGELTQIIRGHSTRTLNVASARKDRNLARKIQKSQEEMRIAPLN